MDPTRPQFYLAVDSTAAPRLVRFAVNSFGNASYIPGSVALPNCDAPVSSMVTDGAGVVFAGCGVAGRVARVRMNLVTVVYEADVVTSAAYSGIRAGIYEPTTGVSYWAVVNGASQVLIATLNHTSFAFSGTYWPATSTRMPRPPTLGLSAGGWAFWVSKDGPNPFVMRLKIPEFNTPSAIQLQSGFGDIVAGMADAATNSGAPGWLYLGYQSDPGNAGMMIANVAGWSGPTTVAMMESVAPTPSLTASPTGSPTGTTTQSSTGSMPPTPSNTDTPPVTPNETGTPSRTESPLFISPSRTVTPSRTPPMTDSVTRTPPVTDSKTATNTASSTGTRSNTVSISLSANPTPSAGASSSGTPAGTPSRTGTPDRASPTGTPTLSPTRSETGTLTATKTGTPTPSRTPASTVSPVSTGTPTVTRTRSPLPTQSTSGTGTPVSPTASKSAGASSSGSPSLTSSVTGSASLSGSNSASPSVTPTASGTPPPLPVANLTVFAVGWDGSVPSRRPTPSNSPSRSVEPTPTNTGSSGASTSGTATKSGTVSVTGSPSATRSPSQTGSVTPTVSASGAGAAPSGSATTPAAASISSSATASTSVSGTAGAVAGFSASGSPGANSSASGSPGANSTGSGGGSGGRMLRVRLEEAIRGVIGRAGSTPAPAWALGPHRQRGSAGSSPARGRRAQAIDDGCAEGPVLVASDAWLPTPFLVTSDLPPGTLETVTVSCSVSLNTALGVVVSPPGGYTFNSSSLGGPTVRPRLLFNITAPFSADQALLDDGAAPDWGVVTCSASSRSTGMFARPVFGTPATRCVSMQVFRLPVRWPLIQDAIVHAAKDGSARSVFDAGYTDIYTDLMGGCNDTAPVGSFCPDSPEAALDNGELVDRVLASKGLGDPSRARNASASGRVFSMDLSGSTHLTLVADSVFWYGNDHARFVEGVRVSIGGIPCNVTWVRGRLMHVITPLLSEVCQKGVECGFKPLSVWASVTGFGTVVDPDNDVDGYAYALEAAAAGGSAVAFPPRHAVPVISCPPFCPGQARGYYPVPAGMSGFGNDVAISVYPGRVDSTTGALTRYAPSVDQQVADPRGIRFTAECPSSIYVKGAVCGDPTDPAHANCAFGEGDDCQRCPIGSYCPGGYAAIPKYGYYVTALDKLPVIRCAAPAEERCRGWNSTALMVQCGPGYRPGSYRCQSCDKGYFVAADGSCDACPPSKIEELLKVLVSFLGSLIGFGLMNYLFILAIAKYVGGTVAGGAKASAQLMIWTFTVIQTIVQVGKAASPGLPGFLRAAYAGLDVFSFGGLSPNTACLAGAYPFLNEATQMGLAMGLLLLVSALQFSYRKLWGLTRIKALQADKSRSTLARAGDSVKPLLRRVIFTALTLMYPIVMKSSMDMMDCTTSVVTVRSYLSMDQDGKSLGKIGVTLPLDPATGRSVSIETLTKMADTDRFYKVLIDRVLPVSSLSSNSYFVCTEASHAHVWALAWVTLLFYGVGYPLGSFLLIRRRMNKLLATHRASAGSGSKPDDTGGLWFCVPALAWLTCGVPPKQVPTRFWGLVERVRALVSRLLGRGQHLPVATGDPTTSPDGGSEGDGGGAHPRLKRNHSRLIDVMEAGSSEGDDSMSGRTGASREEGSAGGSSGGRPPKSGGAGKGLSTATSGHSMRGMDQVVISGHNPTAKRRGGGAGAAAAQPSTSSSSTRISRGSSYGGRGSGGFDISPQSAESDAGPPPPTMLQRWLATLRRYAFCERKKIEDRDAEHARALKALDPVSRYLDGHPELVNATAFAHFTATDYRPSAFYFRNLDMGVLFVLSCLLVFWRRTPDDGAVWVKFLVTIATLSAMCAAIARTHPFNSEERWKEWVKLFSLALAIVASCLNALTGLQDHRDEGSKSLPVIIAGVSGLSYIVFMMSMGLFGMLLGGFWYALVERGRAEGDEIRRRQATQAALALRRVVGGGGQALRIRKPGPGGGSMNPLTGLGASGSISSGGASPAGPFTGLSGDGGDSEPDSLPTGCAPRRQNTGLSLKEMMAVSSSSAQVNPMRAVGSSMASLPMSASSSTRPLETDDSSGGVSGEDPAPAPATSAEAMMAATLVANGDAADGGSRRERFAAGPSAVSTRVMRGFSVF